MKLKLDEEGHVVVEDGKPVYIHDDGKELAFDAASTVTTISRLNGEAKGHREAKEAAEAKLKEFEGIEDPKAAKDALGKLAALKDKDLVDAGKVEEIRAAAIKAKDDEYKPVVEERDKLRSELNDTVIGGAFDRSKFIEEKVAVPRHLLRSTYGQNFKREDGKLVGYDANGNKIYSRAKPGEVAEFDEAIELLINADPYKDQMLKGSGGSGSGAKNGNGSGDNGAKTMPREQFLKLPPAEQAAKVKDGFQVTDAA